MRTLLTLALLTLSTGAADWPELAGNAGRSGATADELKSPFARKWYRLFADEGVQAGVQPIVAAGRVYLGTLRGKLHAIDAATGTDAWVHEAGSPILHAAAVAGDKVFFGTARGGLHAVNVADGATAWTVAIDYGVWCAPAVHDGVVFVGGRDGKVYAVDAATGNVKWTSPTGGPVINSPAIDAKAGRVYVGSEDMHAYAFDVASGKQVWRSPKLPGVSFRGYHPVVAPDGSVMVTVTPGAGGDAMQNVLMDMAKDIFGNFASWRIKSADEKKRLRGENFELMKKPDTHARQLEYLRKRLTDEPSLQTFFVLDGANGRVKFVTPIVYAESMNGPGSPAVVTPAGKVIVKYNVLSRSRYEHYSPFLNVGYLDTATGGITPVMDESRTYGWHDSLLLVHDEQSQIVVGGNVLVNTHQDNVNALDLRTLQGEKQPWAHGVHEVAPGVAGSLFAHSLRGKEMPQGWEWLARGTAVYGGGSAIDVPIVIAGDSFYFLPTHELNAGVALVAYKMEPAGKSHTKLEPKTVLAEKLTAAAWPAVAKAKWDWDTLESPRLNGTLTGLPDQMPGTRLAPLVDAKAKADAITDTRLDALILGNKAGSEKREAGKRTLHEDKLAAAVDELISRDWRPLLFPAAKAPSEAYRIFSEPTETLYTLALAYPHLMDEMRTKVRARVGKLSEAGGSLGKRTYDAGSGAVRSAYDEASPKLLRVVTDVLRSDTARLYPHYRWAASSGEWDRLKRDWPKLKSSVNAEPEKNEADLGNARLSGLIAACRIASHVGDGAALATLLPATRAQIRARLEVEFAHTEGNLITMTGTRSIVGRWHHLTPDLAVILREFTADTHRRLCDVYVDHHRPAWYVAWNVELLWRNESPFSFPDMSADIFAARALILREPAERLASFVDVPWCKADEYYVQKLALLCAAP